MDEPNKKPKSTIVITTEENGDIKLDVKHEPEPAGKRKDWPKNARAAQDMIILYKAYMDRFHNIKPLYEKQKNSMNGSISITERNEP